MVNKVKQEEISQLLTEVADVLAQNNWRGDLQESLRDAANLLGVDENSFKHTTKYLQYQAERRAALHPDKKELWVIIDDYARKVKATDYWSGKILNSTYLTPAHESWDTLRDAIVLLAQKENDYGFKVFPKTMDGREFRDLIDDYARKADVADFFSGKITDKALLAPAYDAHYVVKKALQDIVNATPQSAPEFAP